MGKVSIIVRTCGRPDVLIHCLNSIRNQTYKAIEVVVVEDGKNKSQKMIETQFADLNIQYYATGKNVGRAIAGNIAMEMASGKYLNFLDDDDEFYPEHVETLLNAIENSDCRAVYSVAEEILCRYDKKNRRYVNIKTKVRLRQQFNRVYLMFANYFPIQSVMFEKSLFKELGGFREHIDYLEDWDLWVRYSTVTDYYMVDKITSFYRVPFASIKRDLKLRKARKSVGNLFEEYNMNINLGDCNRELNMMIKEHYTNPVKRSLYRAGSKILHKSKI